MAKAPQTSTTTASNPQLLKPEQLDQLVAPIALYPDTLLAEVLMASAYPTDVVQAERWLESHKNLKGDQLKAAVDKQDWDASIKSLVATPEVLKMMSEKLDWTEKLGDAVVAQQPDVMDAIQRLRARAQANDKLKSTPQQNVSVSQAGGKQVIAIEPTNPDTVYVPYYDPSVVYGEWPYPEYPPYYWEPPSYIGYGLLGTGLAFGAGWALANWGNYWGGDINWSGGGNNIISRPGGRPTHPISGVGDRWQPRVDHRQALRNQGGQRDFRGSRGQQVLKPGAKPGNKPGGGRTNVGNNRPNKGQKVSHRGNQRPTANARPSQRASSNARQKTASNNRGPGRTAHARQGRASVANRGGIRPSPGRANVANRGGFNRGMRGLRAQAGGGLRLGGGLGGGGRSFGGGGRSFGGGGRRGGRRSDIRLKHDITLVGYLNNGLGLYRFSYNGSNKPYVGVLAQEVQQMLPDAVTRGSDGYLRVHYEKLGVKFQSYEEWLLGTREQGAVRMQR